MAGIVTRRSALIAAAGLGAGLGASLLVPRLAQAQLVAQLARTPSQTEGPFYPTAIPLDSDNDLVEVKGSAARARGTILNLTGRVLDPAGKPVAGARVEIWQCDSQGVYLHPRDGDQNRRDAGFQGFGHAISDASGVYGFRTIRPVAYSSRAPHIHFKVLAQGARPLTTQMYVAGDPGNERDFLYRALGAQAKSVTVALTPRPDTRASAPAENALAGNFDIVLG